MHNNRMEPASAAYFYTLATIATTFVGFSALIMMLRQTFGDGLSNLEVWITRTFVQLGFLVTAGALTPPLLGLWQVREAMIWRVCSGTFGAILLIFVVTYPARRRKKSGVSTPYFVWLDLILLLGSIALFGVNAVGRPLPPNAALHAAGLTTALFVSGLGYLHALGNVRPTDDR
jgi:hypothetical protein